MASAASGEEFPVYDPGNFYFGFPHLTDKNHKATSKATPQPLKVVKPYYVYNCFAFVVGDKKKFWWPGGYGYWPRTPSEDTVNELIYVLVKWFGYEPCINGIFEPGVTKVAIFSNFGEPTHVAIQLSSRMGVWKSKMAYNIDMEHELHAIETWDCDDPKTQGFGKVVQFMRLVKSKRYP